MKVSKRNGKIDMLRFIFALFIMFLHSGYRPRLQIGNYSLVLGINGSFGVYFFFIVSGVLMMASVEKDIVNSKSIKTSVAEDHVRYLVRKYTYYIKWYLAAFLLCFLLDAVRSGVIKSVTEVIKSIPSLLLLGSLGFSDSSYSIGYYVGASWYISSLFVIQIIILPIIRNNYKMWCCIIAPIVLIITLSLQVNGYSDRILRAMTPITIGTMLYELRKKLEQFEYVKSTRIMLGALEFFIYVFIIVYMCSDVDKDIVWGAFFLTATGVLLSFSQATHVEFLDKPFFVYLGKISFPLYLLHIQVLDWADYLLTQLEIPISDRVRYPIMYALCILIAVVAYGISERYNSREIIDK